MKNWSPVFKIAAIVLAATIGEGFFALPYVFYQSGWVVGLGYLVVLVAVVIFAQVIYLKTLERVGEKERLLGLAKKYFGAVGFWIGLIAILVGLLLALVAYLILGPRFIELAFPGISPQVAFLIIWLGISIPALVSNRRAVTLEIAGVILVASVMLFVFGNGLISSPVTFASLANHAGLFLPFGIILLSLAGWTGIEPAYESGRKIKKSRRVLGVVLGTILAALLYVLFVGGIFRSVAQITPDTLSGILNWVPWKRFLIAALGLFAIGTGSVPITHEIRNAFEKDMQWPAWIARAVIIFLPALAVLAGFNQFLLVLGLAGGCFIALQYLLIIAVGRRALALSVTQKFLLDAVVIAFALVIVYELYSFVVR